MGGRGAYSMSAATYQARSDHQTDKSRGRVVDMADIAELDVNAKWIENHPGTYQAYEKLIGADPDTLVTVYRGDRTGSTGGSLNTGDWITLDPSIAAGFALTPFGSMREGAAMYSFQVRAGDIYRQYEKSFFGYFGKRKSRPSARNADWQSLRNMRDM